LAVQTYYILIAFAMGREKEYPTAQQGTRNIERAFTSPFKIPCSAVPYSPRFYVQSNCPFAYVRFVKSTNMAAREYVFIDQFFAACDITDAYDYIANIRDYPQWWGNVYKKIEKLNNLDDDQPGVQYAVTIGGFLPYKLTISNEVTHIHKPYIIRFKAFGDLQGHGTWYFNASEGGTTITFDWRVVANKAVIRWFSFLLKPLFRANHHYCVKEAEKGIRNDLIRNGRLSPQTVVNHRM
jgi:hypothetical protein